MANAGLRIALVLYNVLSSTPTHADTSSPGEHQHTLELEVLGQLQISVEDADLGGRSLVVGILDYEWGDATGKPIMSMKDVSSRKAACHASCPGDLEMQGNWLRG
ncbi:hypothetical protein B0H21DRAFT_306959 [Amylocystis lapponica]|nr:hypothetical protein B0H21DRAFT_306959 [Amylocystis lapponica]